MNWIWKHDAHNSQLVSQCLQHDILNGISYVIHSWNWRVVMGFRRKSWHRHTFVGKNIFHLYYKRNSLRMLSVWLQIMFSFQHCTNTFKHRHLSRSNLSWRLQAFYHIRYKEPEIFHMNSVWLDGERQEDVHLCCGCLNKLWTKQLNKVNWSLKKRA